MAPGCLIPGETRNVRLLRVKLTHPRRTLPASVFWGRAFVLVVAAAAASARCDAGTVPAQAGAGPVIDPTGPGIWQSRSVETRTVRPNALSRARALSEAAATGPPPAVPGRRPSLADNSTFVYLPPVGKQQIGDCTSWAAAYYYSTYTQARDEGLDAAGNDPDVICSPRFLFCLISKGHYGAECTEHAMNRLADVGCATVASHPIEKDHRKWPTETAWVDALQHRTRVTHSIRADSLAGLERVKQCLANGHCVVSRGVMATNFHPYPDNEQPGIDNRVLYSRAVKLKFRHSLCIVGYDDNRSYTDHRDGKTHRGAFLVVNSEGPDWGWHNSTERGSKGFFWLAYTMLLEGQFGYYDDPWPGRDPSYDNAPYPEVYYNDDRPQYRPRLFAVAGITHAARNTLTLTAGIADARRRVGFRGPEAIEPTDVGTIPVDDDNRIAIDLTDGAHLLTRGVPLSLFVALTVDASVDTNGAITSASFFADLDEDGAYATLTSPDPPVTVLPGTTGYSSVRTPPAR
jgi:hypothetical protein